jgi:hypothetical protein
MANIKQIISPVSQRVVSERVESQGSKPQAKRSEARDDSARMEAAATRLGGEVDKLEKQLLNAYEKPDVSDKNIKKLELQYKNATIALEGFMQLMKSKHEMIMRGIDRLLIR